MQVLSRKYLFIMLIMFFGFMLVVFVVAFLYAQARVVTGAKRIAASATPDEYGLSYEQMEVISNDGLRLKAWFIPPPEDALDQHVVIFVHGLSSNRLHFINEARLLYAAGLGSVLFDMRAHGTSEGTQTTMGAMESEDILVILEHLTREKHIDQVALIGESTGGAAAILATAKHPGIKGVMTVSAFASGKNLLSGLNSRLHLPNWVAEIGIRWIQLFTPGELVNTTPTTEIGKIAPRPVALIHGGRDTTVSVENAHELYQAANSPVTLWIVPEAGHGVVGWLRPEDYEMRLREFTESAFGSTVAE